MVSIDALVAGACSQSQLERSKALSSISVQLKTSSVDVGLLERSADALLLGSQWEERLGGLELARLLVKDAGRHGDAAYRHRVSELVCRGGLLEDPEVRVRKAAGELLGDMSARGAGVWEVVRDAILESIERNYSREDGEDQGADETAVDDPISSLLQQSYKAVKPGVGEMRHDTEGWKCLETSFLALNNIMVGYGSAFGEFVDAGLAALVFKSAKHPNRFVREACQFIMGTMCDILDEDRVCDMRVELASCIGFGLSDNWSQVRYAASVAARKFVLATPHRKEDVLPLVLPQMCLNRYYVADGVRFYSQQTWQLAVGDQGKDWVATCIHSVVSYYVEQSKASNHTVREAACSCIAELVTKIDRGAVAPHVPRLLSCLLTSFRDASWPVRDAACLATGQCVLAFPEESRDVLKKLYKLWFAHLEDNIFSVREDSAVALGNAVRAYGKDAVDQIRDVLLQLLPRAKEQEDRAREDGEPPGSSPGSARSKLPADPKHSDQLMFSCGSLAPKLKRGVDCCGDYGLTRAPEPWEASDGAVYMVRELAAAAPADAVEFLPMLAALGQMTHFTQYVTLHETLWKCLPEIAQSIGKAAFKKTLELFLGPLFKDARCGHPLCETAAQKCIARLCTFIGKPIFVGRLDADHIAVFDSLGLT